MEIIYTIAVYIAFGILSWMPFAYTIHHFQEAPRPEEWNVLVVWLYWFLWPLFWITMITNFVLEKVRQS